MHGRRAVMQELTPGERRILDNALRRSLTTINNQAEAAARARIIAWLRHEADHGPVGGGPACRYVADLLERGS